MLHTINLRHFFALSDIARFGRLSSAAEHLYMSQSALTQALKKIEAQAGVPLFERSGFGVGQSQAGKLLVRRVQRAVELLSSAEREIRARHSKAIAGTPLHRHVTAGQLRALVAVTETGGYSTAARRLGLAQPTVHRAARDLENLMGVDLFSRTARGAEPSDVAILLARYTSLMFAEIRQGFEEVWEMQGRTDSRILIGSLPLARSDLVPTAVTRLLARYPDARVSVLDGPYVEQLHALRHGQIDWLVGALRDPPPTADIVQELLFEQPLAVVVRPGHPLLESSNPTAAQLAKLDWVAPRALTPARKFFDEFFESNKAPIPKHVIECSSLIATRGLLLQSDRAALLSPLQVREDVAAKQLAMLIPSIPNSFRSIGITVRDNWEPTQVQLEFANIMRKLALEVRAPFE